jgi:hypothetical protein
MINFQNSSFPASITSLNITLPSEVHFFIFEHIENFMISACLGLTCKAFYPSIAYSMARCLFDHP